jgi:hypothetical protein
MICGKNSAFSFASIRTDEEIAYWTPKKEWFYMADANHNPLPLRGIGCNRKADAHAKEASLTGNHITHEQAQHYDAYIGTAEALAGAGIVDARLTSARPDRSGVTIVVVGPSGEKWGEGYIEISVKSGCLLEVKAGIPEAERVRRQQAWEARMQADQASATLRTAQQRAALELLELPRSHEQYRNGCVRTLRAHLNIVRNTAIAMNKYSGFHFDDDALRDFDRAAEQLAGTLLRGGIKFVAAVQEQRISEIMSQSSRADMTFQNFLQHLTARADGSQDPPA